MMDVVSVFPYVVVVVVGGVGGVGGGIAVAVVAFCALLPCPGRRRLVLCCTVAVLCLLFKHLAYYHCFHHAHVYVGEPHSWGAVALRSALAFHPICSLYRTLPSLSATVALALVFVPG